MTDHRWSVRRFRLALPEMDEHQRQHDDGYARIDLVTHLAAYKRHGTCSIHK